MNKGMIYYDCCNNGCGNELIDDDYLNQSFVESEYEGPRWCKDCKEPLPVNRIQVDS